jgi:hypothetical protein
MNLKKSITRDMILVVEKSCLNFGYQLINMALKLSRFIRQKVKNHEKNALQYGNAFLEKPVAIMKLRQSGFGDMLSQINKFLWSCDYHNYTGKLYHNGENCRNELSVKQVFSFLNLSQDNLLSQHFNSQKTKSFSSFYSQEEIEHYDLTSPIYFEFDKTCYSFPEIDTIKNNYINPHPDLCDIFQESKLYDAVKRRRCKLTKKRICVHVRRGDVAQIPVSVIRPLIKDEIDSNQILHEQGVFDPDEIKTHLHESVYTRFRSVNSHMEVLDNLLEKYDEDFEIILVSDGMTKLARGLKGKFNDMLINSSVSLRELERQLERELTPLIERSQFCIIGEKDNLWNTLVESLCSDFIISKSPGFIGFSSKLCEFGTKVIYVR